MPQQKQAQHVQSKQSGPGVSFTSVLKWFWKKVKPQGSGVDFTRTLPDSLTQNVLGSYLPNPDILSMHQTSKKLNGIFHVQMDVVKTLKHVVEGDVDALMVLIKDNPGLLFKKGNAKAPRGQTYYNVSPYILMNFLCDEDMQTKIMSLIPERFNQKRQDQAAEIGRGGADLVTLDFDPMFLTSDDFKKIIEFKTSVNVFGAPTDITFPLLENPDGLLYWKDAQGEVNFYYAHRDTQTIIPLVPVATTPEEQRALDAFKHSFDTMEDNSARRSTNKEHQLIAKLMHHALHRQGIHYSDVRGEHYRDSHTPFQLINRCRTSIRLYQEAVHNGQCKKAHRYWREGVGRAQGEEMWLLQRICEENRPFYPLPQNFDAFQRGFVFSNWMTGADESTFMDGRLVDGLGSDFSLYKGNSRRGVRSRAWIAGADGGGGLDLIAVCRLVEDAKTKTIGLALESDLVLQPVSGPQH